MNKIVNEKVGGIITGKSLNLIRQDNLKCFATFIFYLNNTKKKIIICERVQKKTISMLIWFCSNTPSTFSNSKTLKFSRLPFSIGPCI